MKNGRVVGTAHTADVTKDDVLGMIILGKRPPGAVPGPGADGACGAADVTKRGVCHAAGKRAGAATPRIGPC